MSQHLHVYRRVKHPERKDLWMCVSDGCNHRVNKMWMQGKKASCFYCGAPFVITAVKLQKQGFLHCDNCKKTTKPTEKVDLTATIEQELDNLL